MTGKIVIVGIGPGNRDDTTPRAIKAIQGSSVIIGHRRSLDWIDDLIAGKEKVAGNLSPIERAEIAVQRALAGSDVAVVTTGDPGIYAIASVLLDKIKRESLNLDVTVVPGLPAATVASALLGSPIGQDFATISLSDQAEPWDKIKERLRSAAESDFVIVLYNPRGKVGDSRLKEAIDLLCACFKTSTPVGILTDMGGKNQRVNITTLGEMLQYKIDEQTLIIFGNSKTFVHCGRMITPRNYIKGVGY